MSTATARKKHGYEKSTALVATVSRHAGDRLFSTSPHSSVLLLCTGCSATAGELTIHATSLVHEYLWSYLHWRDYLWGDLCCVFGFLPTLAWSTVSPPPPEARRPTLTPCTAPKLRHRTSHLCQHHCITPSTSVLILVWEISSPTALALALGFGEVMKKSSIFYVNNELNL